MQSLRDDRRNRHLFWVLGSCIALTSSAALADKSKDKTKTDAITQTSELMKFDHVQVVNLPAAPSSKSAAKTAAPGIRVYVDDDGHQMAPTAARAAELDAADAARARSSTSSSAEEQGPQIIYGAGTIYRVGDEFAVYQVAHKTDGRVVVQETTGKVAAEKAATATPVATMNTEVSNER